MLAIIGGTGLTQLDGLDVKKRLIVRTPYGDPSQPLIFGEIAGREVIFLARHGGGHNIPPHAVNYRANIFALHMQGVTEIAAIATVGGIHPSLTSGVIAIPHQMIDYTYGRAHTFHDGVDRPVRHTDFTRPYCDNLRNKWISAAKLAGEAVVNEGVYAAMQGPRFETAAEIIRLERDGATMVGMTGMPEAVLARELDISYAAACPVANVAAGKGESARGIHYEDLMQHLNATMVRVRNIIVQLAVLPDAQGAC